MRRNKWNSGVYNATAKLTPALVQDIREEYAKGGISYRELATLYGVTSSNIGRIIRRETWLEEKNDRS